MNEHQRRMAMATGGVPTVPQGRRFGAFGNVATFDGHGAFGVGVIGKLYGRWRARPYRSAIEPPPQPERRHCGSEGPPMNESSADAMRGLLRLLAKELNGDRANV